jgi:YHS domain-containing protein
VTNSTPGTGLKYIGMKRKRKLTIKGKKIGIDKQSVLLISFFGVIALGVLYWNFSNIFSRIPVEVGENERVPNELVCMVNDAFMGVEQIPVEAEGKTYYGCCQMCVTKIKENQDNVRYATDPYTKEKVDKSEAFITLKTDKGKAVLYFASENNMKAFFEELGNLE